MNPAQPEWYRLHYCGVCKSIGRKYDQKSRFLLNRDTVFLAEILTVLASDDTAQWDKSIQNYQCFSLPKAGNIPTSLDYASDLAMLLAQLKLKDNQSDDLKTLWTGVERLFRKPFGKIRPFFKKWHIDETQVQSSLIENQTREHSSLPPETTDWQGALAYYAQPSAQITAYFFALGADAIGKAELKGQLFDLGYRFGALIYSLDAVQDFQEDVQAGQFNPLSRFFGAKRSVAEMFTTTADYLWALSAAVEGAINAIPLPEDVQKSLSGRLMLNLSSVISGGAKPCPIPSSGIEKASVPRFNRFLRTVFSSLNPVYPGRFAISYLVLLFLAFGNKLWSSVALVAQKETEHLDWGFLTAAASFPVLAYLAARRVKKWQLLAWLKKTRDKLKRKVAQLKDKDNNGAGWIILIISIILVLILLLVIVGKTGECCKNESEKSCAEGASSSQSDNKGSCTE